MCQYIFTLKNKTFTMVTSHSWLRKRSNYRGPTCINNPWKEPILTEAELLSSETMQSHSKWALGSFFTYIYNFSQLLCFSQQDPTKNWPTLHVLCYIINWISVIMNPIIYVATQEKYRVAIRLLWNRVRYFNDPAKASAMAFHLEARRSSAPSKVGLRSSVSENAWKET